MKLYTSLEEAIAENTRLLNEISRLQDKIRFLETHQTLAAGIAGERLISGIIGGQLTAHTASIDLIMPDAQRIEIKMAKLSYPHLKKPSNPSRWQWGKIFGETNTKKFDYIILIGEADPRFSADYKDSLSTYVIFVIDYPSVTQFTSTHTRGARAISLYANPRSKGPKSRFMFENLQVTIDELEQRFGSFKNAMTT